jgi:hypothetical protein
MDAMTDTVRVRWAVDQVLTGNLAPMLALLAQDVEFQLALGSGLCREESGKAPVASYFRMLGEMVTFWQMDYTSGGDELIAWGKESFTVEPCGIEAGSDFALVFNLRDGLITRLLVVEDLASFIWNGGTQNRSSSLVDPEPNGWKPQNDWEPEAYLEELAVSGEFPTP